MVPNLRGSSHELERLSFRDPGATVFDPDEFEFPRARYRHEERNEGIGSGPRVQAGSKELSTREPGLESVQEQPWNHAAITVPAVARLHCVRDQGLDLDHVADPGTLWQSDARFRRHRLCSLLAATTANSHLDGTFDHE